MDYQKFLGLAMRNPSAAMQKVAAWRESHPDNTEKAFAGIVKYLSETLPTTRPDSAAYDLTRRALVVTTEAQARYVRSGLLHESMLLLIADLGDCWIASGNSYDFSWGCTEPQATTVASPPPPDASPTPTPDTGDVAELTTESVLKALSLKLNPLDYATITKAGVAMQVFPSSDGKYALRVTGASPFKLKRLTPKILNALDDKVVEVFS